MSLGLFENLQFPIKNDEFFTPFPFDYSYNWVFGLAVVAGFFTAYGIGANDVANAFGTSVGSKSLKVWQAIVIASVCEFGGAVLLGSKVTDTIRKKIIDPDLFVDHSDLLMFGMLCVDLVVGIWLYGATAYSLPVSTTHSTIGAIVGFALCTPGGINAVSWKTVGNVVGSWFLSPILSGITSALIYLFIRTFILRSQNSFQRVLVFFPLLVSVTVFICTVFIIYKGGKGAGWADTPFEVGLPISAGVGAGVGMLVFLTVVPYMKRKLEDLSEDTEHWNPNTNTRTPENNTNQSQSSLERFSKQNIIHESVNTNERVRALHQNAELFPYRTEKAFNYLQIFTAIFNSFSHGANDVANAIGPLSTVYAIWSLGPNALTDSKKVSVELWILALGGFGIIVGLATFGYKIMSVVGVQLVKITPTRGFSIELATSLIIVTGSFLGLPLSTTHCLIGATIGVGIAEEFSITGVKTSVNWSLMGKVFFGWLITLIIAGSFTAALFSFSTFGPSQIYPISPSNCLREYGKVNQTVCTTLDQVFLIGDTLTAEFI